MMAGYSVTTGVDDSWIDGGWFSTGDLARLDSAGNIHLLGRQAEVINVGGMKVVPNEVEEVISALPGVRNVKVYAGSRRRRGTVRQGGHRRRHRNRRRRRSGPLRKASGLLQAARRDLFSTPCRNPPREKSSPSNFPDGAGPMHLGAWQLDTINGGRFRIDGGVLFGLVPKSLWGNLRRPMPRTRRLRQPLRAGPRRPAHRAHRHGLRHQVRAAGPQVLRPGGGRSPGGGPGRVGVAPEDVDTVVLTHLHFDHVGGATVSTIRGSLCPPFPRPATWSTGWNGRTRRSAARNCKPPIRRTTCAAGRKRPGGPARRRPAIVPGLTGVVTGGHTRGHLAVKISSAGQTAFFIGDLCPTTAHLRRMWCTAYDITPWRRAAASRAS